nr:hypothetical protein B0A51_14732 [Rachicladosporium sp. CCFEE 5018]
MATLSVGGNDIDLLGIARSCILELFPPRSCEEQIKRSWSLIRSPDLANNIEKVISAAITKGRAGSAGDAFKLYVLGYADFYNVDTDQCSTVTFARNPKRDGSSQKMTKELRQTFNDMANELNGAIAEAVNRQGSQSAFYVDWQANGGLTGHRYCEEGVIEPDTNRADTWFWHWPYGTRAEEDALDNVLASIWDPSVSTLAEFDTKHGGNPPPMPDSLQDSNTFWNTVFDHSNNDTLGLEGALSNRVRVLHPTEPGHVHIRDSVLAQLVVDLAPAAPIVDPTPPVGACNTKYAILLDEVNIKGANWDEADFKNGDGLHDQMKGCGALTGWNFNANLVDPEYKWEATFNLPIGTKPCVQRAIVSAGGDPEKCSGTS